MPNAGVQCTTAKGKNTVKFSTLKFHKRSIMNLGTY